MKKKILISAGIVVVLLIAVLLVLHFFGSKSITLENPDTDSMYPYQMKLTKQSLSVEIFGGEDDCRWVASSSDGGVLYPTEQAEAQGSQTFLVKPVSVGHATVDFDLMNPEHTADVRYRISLDLKLEDQEITLLGCGHQPLTGLIEDEAGRYSISQQDEGSYVVCMKATMGADWSVPTTYLSEVLAVNRFDPSGVDLADLPSTEPAQVHSGAAPDRNTIETPDTYYRIESIGAGTAEVHIINRNNGEYLQLQFGFDENFGLILLSHEMLAGEADKPKLGADWIIPEIASVSQVNETVYLSQLNGKEASAEEAMFSYADTVWILTRSAELTRDDFCAAEFGACLAELEAGKDTVATEAEGVRYYQGSYSLLAAWDKDGYGYQLGSMLPRELEALQSMVALLNGDSQ